AELVAPIIHEDAALIDADIDIQWCRAVANIETCEADALTLRTAALDRVARIAAKTPRGEAIKLKHAPMDETAKAELQARAEALAAEYAAPLPEGDAGLIEAERRLREIRQQTRSLFREFKIDVQTEEAIII